MSGAPVAGYQPWKSNRQWSPAHVFERYKGSSTVDDALDILYSRGCFRQLPDGSIGDLRFALTPDNPTHYGFGYLARLVGSAKRGET